jgi:hypothetical protein
MTDSTEIERIMQVLRDRAGMPDESPKPRAAEPQTIVTLPEDNIPMLTEVVQVPRYSKNVLPQAIDDVQWTALSEKVQVNVMERLLRRSEQLIDAHLKQDLAVIIARATETLAADLQSTLSQSIRDMVSAAVADELTRLQSEITFSQHSKN